MLGLAFCPALVAATIGSPPAPPLSEQSDPRFALLQRVSDEELGELRGGFSWNGVEIGLGAEVRTYLNGQLVLQTNISWTAAGAQTTQMVSGALRPADAAQLQAGILTSGGITMRVGQETVFLANQGQTAILHRTDGAIQNVLINRASNIEARQEIDAVLDLQNFGDFQQDVVNNRIANSLGDMVGDITIGNLNN
jgi:hypothetical protein